MVFRRGCGVLLALVMVGALTEVGPVAAERMATPPGASPDGLASMWANQALNRLSLEQKVGQLFVVSVWGKTADEVNATNQANYGVDTPAEVVKKYNVGGGIYFNKSTTDNVDSPRQVAELSNRVQLAAVQCRP